MLIRSALAEITIARKKGKFLAERPSSVHHFLTKRRKVFIVVEHALNYRGKKALS